jgi:hypothetical protein
VPHDRFGGISTLRSSAYIETPYQWAHTVYLFYRPPTVVDQWTFILVFVRLGHRNMEQYLGPLDLARIPSLDLSYEFPTISPEPSKIFLYLCEDGDTLEINIASLNLLEHLATYVKGT